MTPHTRNKSLFTNKQPAADLSQTCMSNTLEEMAPMKWPGMLQPCHKCHILTALNLYRMVYLQVHEGEDHRRGV